MIGNDVIRLQRRARAPVDWSIGVIGRTIGSLSCVMVMMMMMMMDDSQKLLCIEVEWVICNSRW